MTSVMTQKTAGIVLALKSVTGINKQMRRALLGVLPTDTANKFGDCNITRMHKALPDEENTEQHKADEDEAVTAHMDN